MTCPVLELSDVSFDYQLAGKTFQALSGVNLKIFPGEFVAIIGTSGSGKTTLMNLMGLMARPTRGRILLNGTDVTDSDENQKSTLRNENIGFVFQQFHLLPRLTVEENISLPLSYSSGRGFSATEKARQKSLIARLGMTEQLGKLPAKLSGGQKQRTALCRALILEPSLILADEPTGALDSGNTTEVLETFTQLNAEGCTIVVITHDPNVAKRAQRIIRIVDGKIVSDEQNPDYQISASTQLSPRGEVRLHRNFTLLLTQLTRNAQTAAQSLLSHKVRSSFTIFGLTVGVMCIIIMISLTTEARSAFTRFFKTSGASEAWVTQERRAGQAAGGQWWKGIHINNQLPKVAALFLKYGRIDAEKKVGNCLLKSPTRSETATLEGFHNTAKAGEAEWKMAHGRYFTPSEINPEGHPPQVAILGSEIASKLFPARDPGFAQSPDYPAGTTLFVTGCDYGGVLTIVGVLKPRDSTLDSRANDDIYVPTRTLIAGGASPYIRDFVVVPHAGVSGNWLGDSLAKYLKIRSQGLFDFHAYSSEHELKMINIMLNVLGALTVCVGLLCTLIGGIGVMNIMLVTITERIREIGLRKALGAKVTQIRNQFLLESLVLCIISGVVGVFAGLVTVNLVAYLAAQALPNFLEYAVVWNHLAVGVSLATSVLGGLFFGILPAQKAGNMDVVEALRRE